MSKRFLLLFVLVLALAGCSSGSNNPLTSQGDQTAGSIDNLPIIGASIFEDGSFNAIGMLGAYEMSINPANNTAELVAKRTSAIGESYVVSGIGFFTVSPCPSCLKLKGISLTPDGNAELTFSISHPFEKGDILKPPTAINRLDLDVFDLAMVIAPQEAVASTYSQTGASAYTGFCVGTDGYTTELNEVIEDSAALPYFLIIDDSIGGTSSYNKFEMGMKDIEFDATFNLASGDLNFDLYLTMGYGWSAKKPDRLIPEYYNPEFNRKAAWKVDVTPPAESWPAGDGITTRDVVVEVYDWQIGANVDSELVNPTDIYAASEVSNVSVEIPGMNSALQSVTTEDSGAGTPDDPLVYTFAIANENLLEEGDYFGLVKVTDERAVGSIGDRDFIIDSPDGILLEHFNLPEFATFQLFTASVEGAAGEACFTVDIHKYFDGIGPDGTADNPVPTEWLIDFDASCSIDALTFDWDIDGDGTYEVEGLTYPVYTAGYPAGTALGTYYPVLRINGSDSTTFTFVDGIVLKTGVYVDSAIGTGAGPGDAFNPFDTIANGVAGVTTPAETTLLIRGDDGSSGQLNYPERVDLTSAHTGFHIQGYSLNDSNSIPPAMRNYRPSGRDVGSSWYMSECFFGDGATGMKIDGFEFDHIRGPEHGNTGGWHEQVRIIHFENSDNVQISHIYFHDHLAETEYQGWKPGYGIYLSNCDNAKVNNIIFCDSSIPADFGTVTAIYAAECDSIVVANNTVDQIEWCTLGNCTAPANVRGVHIANSISPQIINTVISNLFGSAFDFINGCSRGIIGSGNTSPVADYCNVWNILKLWGNPIYLEYYSDYRFYGDITEGANCINPGDPLDDYGLDPLYENGHHLQASSPCIDAGDPDAAYNDYDGSQNDIGCYGGPGGDWNFED